MENEICSEAGFELLISAKQFASSVFEKEALEELFSVAILLVDDRPMASGMEILNTLQTIARRRGFAEEA